MVDAIAGNCLCGAIEYSIKNDFGFLLFCHCQQYRKISGSAHAANLFSASNSLVWLKGEMDIRRFDLPGRDFTKAFCKTCGCGLPYRSNDSGKVIVPAGTLSSEPNFSQQSKVFLSECAEWARTGPETYPGFPEF